MKKAFMIGLVALTLVGCGKTHEVTYADAYVYEVKSLADGYDLVTVETKDGNLYDFVEEHDSYHAPYTKIIVIDGEMDRLA